MIHIAGLIIKTIGAESMDLNELFENGRVDIEELMEIISEWKAEHPKDSKVESAERFLNTLDYIHMVW